MKILFVQKVKALAGSEKYFLELLPALERSGIRTEFACICNSEDKNRAQLFIDACREKGLKIHVLDVKSDRAIFKTLRFLKNILEKGDFDLVHSHLIHADFWMALLKKTGRLKIPLVSTKHGYDEAYLSRHGFDASYIKRNRYYRMCRFAEKHIDRSFAVSKGLQQFFADAGICPIEKMDVIHHGFDLTELERKENLHYRLSQHQLLIIGRIIPFKGHRYLIDALPIVKAKFPDFCLVIAGHGDDDLVDELKQKIRQMDVEKNVVFTGYTTQSNDYLLNSDLLVVPSIAEGFGLVFLEALNAKTAVAGFDVPATNEIIEHEKTGILVPPYSVEVLGQSIVELLEDKKRAGKFADAGFKKLKAYFTLDRMVSQTRTFYESVLLSRNNSGKAK